MHAQNLTPPAKKEFCPTARRCQSNRSGFTLTELLVVIAIISMLVAIVSVAVVAAIGQAKQTRIKTEIDLLDMAMKSYKEKYGAFPPCDLRINHSDNAVKNAALAKLRQHFATAFPRYDITQLPNDLAGVMGDAGKTTGLSLDKFRPDQALVFFLRGFGPDPTHPFVSLDGIQIENGRKNGIQVKLTPLFDFDQSRLASVDNTGVDSSTAAPTFIAASYFPAGVKANAAGAPYLYWDSGNYGVLPANQDLAAADRKQQFNTSKVDGIVFANAGVANIYANDANGDSNIQLPNETWANPETFQLIASGMDGKYGVKDTDALNQLRPKARLYPTGIAYDMSVDLADDDNVTNFANKAKLVDAKP